MATSAVTTESDIDAANSLYCDGCELDGEAKPAAGFCTTCLEYLCDDCLKYHCRPRKMRDHKVVGKDLMPKYRVSYELLDTKCECGTRKDVIIYCQFHQQLLCISCKAESHKNCPFDYISVLSKETEKSQEYLDFKKELDNYQSELIEEKGSAKHQKGKCYESFEQFLKEITFLQKLLEEKLSDIDRIKEEGSKTYEDYSRKMEYIERENGNAVNNIRVNTEDLETLEKFAQDEKLFVALHKSREYLTSLKREMVDINKDNVLSTYQFIPCSIIKTMLTNIGEIGKIVESTCHSGCSVTDYVEYGLPKCLALSGTCVVVIDRIHNILHKVENTITTAQIKLRYGPWDIAKVSSTSMIVSHPRQETCSVIALTADDIHIEKEIEVKCRCEGIAYAEGKIYIASTKPPCVVVYDIRNSSEERRIVDDRNGHALFEQPAYIDVNPHKHLICVSDRKLNKVVVLNDTGNCVKEFQSNDMKMPLTVAFRDNFAVVIGFQSNTVNKIFYEKERARAIDTKFFHDVAIYKVFRDDTFEMDASWKYCASKYFTLACKNTM